MPKNELEPPFTYVCERNIAGTGAIKIADFFCTFCAIKDAIFTVRQ